MAYENLVGQVAVSGRCETIINQSWINGSKIVRINSMSIQDENGTTLHNFEKEFVAMDSILVTTTSGKLDMFIDGDGAFSIYHRGPDVSVSLVVDEISNPKETEKHLKVERDKKITGRARWAVKRELREAYRGL